MIWRLHLYAVIIELGGKVASTEFSNYVQQSVLRCTQHAVGH
jgi:hypothetical protein